MLSARTLDKLLFVDIETCSQFPTFKNVPAKLQEIFKKRFWTEIEKLYPHGNDESDYYYSVMDRLYGEKAGLYAEYNKIVCISVGRFKNLPTGLGIGPYTGPHDQPFQLDTFSFYGDDEKKILTDFYTATKSELDRSIPTIGLVAHSGLLFDFPVIAQRYMLNRMPIPAALDYTHQKPWDIEYLIDTALTWKYGRFDGGASLDMLAYQFDIKSSKEGIDGSMVNYEYWTNKDLSKIEKYCREDVRVLAEVYLRMKNIWNPVEVI